MNVRIPPIKIQIRPRRRPAKRFSKTPKGASHQLLYCKSALCGSLRQILVSNGRGKAKQPNISTIASPMISSKRVANAVSGKTARACDGCIKKRARWYCAADDAFLCQACDSSVHSANQLARRHERVRLKTASFKHFAASENSAPSWHGGFTRKARTPRNPKASVKGTLKSQQYLKWMNINLVPSVPEVGADDISHEENEEEQLLYRVPIFDPLVAELCTCTHSSEADTATVNGGGESEIVAAADSKARNKAAICGQDGEKSRGFFPSDLDLAEFAADVESMLGKGLENQSFGMEGLGLVDSNEKDLKLVKVEEDECEETARECHGGGEADQMEVEAVERETFELNLDYDSPASCGEEDDHHQLEKDEETMKSGGEYEEENSGRRTKVLLSLDYEAVIGAWASRGSPWTTADRPKIDLDECLPEFAGFGGKGINLSFCYFAGTGTTPTVVDGGREARVSRYREKRRTRLFSKKIRYEVRKLNAEKRPRMKGRFVKRASFAAPTPSFLL